MSQIDSWMRNMGTRLHVSVSNALLNLTGSEKQGKRPDAFRFFLLSSRLNLIEYTPIKHLNYKLRRGIC